jgi:hypothetical protein
MKIFVNDKGEVVEEWLIFGWRDGFDRNSNG